MLAIVEKILQDVAVDDDILVHFEGNNKIIYLSEPSIFYSTP